MRNISEISISHGPCFGNCPVSVVTILPSGNLLYAGQESVPRIGHFRARFGRRYWENMCRLVEDVGFFEQPESIGQIDDWPTTTFRVVANGKVKSVEVQALDWPYELWLLESALNGFLALEQRRWEAEDSGLRGQFEHLQSLPHAQGAEVQKWDKLAVRVVRQTSPAAVLPVDEHLSFYPQVDETGTFSLPLRPGRYQVFNYNRKWSYEVLIRPDTWQEITIPYT